MRKPQGFWLALLLVVGLLTGASAFAASASAASPIPWDDPNALGYIGFCDTKGHQIHSGSTLTYPFVNVAVSSTAPPSGYQKPYGRAVLYAYQPIQYVDPADWSGMQMTGASAFTNDKAPMTEGLGKDHSLFNLNAAYPLHWNGLAQLRIYYTAFNQPEYVSKYPAAVVRISGKTWTQVGGGKVNCTAGKVVSNERILPNPSKSLAPANPTSHPSAASTTGAGSSTSASDPSGSGSNASSDPSAAADSHHTKSSGSAGLIVTLVVIIVLCAAGGFWALRRRRAPIG